MAGGTGASISSPPSPNNGRDPGLIGRLLQRKTSTKGSRFRRRSTGSTVVPLLIDEDPESDIPAAAAQQQPSNAAPNAAADITQPQPQLRQMARTSAFEMPSATPQPFLKKKASFRDRLKAWQKPPLPLETVDEARPRVIYEPKHAAADFSRLVVSPTSPTRPRLPPMQTLVEGDSFAVTPLHTSQKRRSRNHDRGHPDPKRERERERDDDYTRRHSSRSGSTANRHSHTVAQDPYQASHAAVQIPVNSRPVAWIPGGQLAARREDSPSASTDSNPPSDYELFLARAEADDRARREKVLRSMSQRSTAAGAGVRVKPDPHRQYAAVGEADERPRPRRGELSAGEHREQRREQRREQQREQQNQQQQREERDQQQEKRATAGRGHARHASWAPGHTAGRGSGDGNNGVEVLEKARRPSAAQPRRVSEPVVYGVDEDFNGAQEYKPAPPRMLRRQASLTQRFVEYIRPPKMTRAVETLVE